MSTVIGERGSWAWFHSALLLLAGFVTMALAAACAEEPLTPAPPWVTSTTHPLPSTRIATTPPPAQARASPTPLSLSALPPGLYAVVAGSEDADLTLRSLEGAWIGPLASVGDFTFSASLAPDLTRLAFTSYAARLAILDLTSGAVDTSTCNAQGSQPSWSPDGTMIAFSTNMSWHDESEDWGSLAVCNLADQTITRLTFWWTSETTPAWSPDGRWLAFSADYHLDCPCEDDIYLYDLSCQDRPRDCAELSRRLTFSTPPDAASFPSWSPDSHRLVYECGIQGNGELCLLDLPTGRTTTLTRSAEYTELRPIWSPDGQWIGFTRWNLAFPFEHAAMMMRPDGSQERELSEGQDERFVQWVLVP